MSTAVRNGDYVDAGNGSLPLGDNPRRAFSVPANTGPYPKASTSSTSSPYEEDRFDAGAVEPHNHSQNCCDDLVALSDGRSRQLFLPATSSCILSNVVRSGCGFLLF